MKILFVMRNAHYLRNYESVIASLCRRRHRVVVGLELGSDAVPSEVWLAAERLEHSHAGFVHITTLPERRPRWPETVSQVRALRDYCRYHLPPYQQSPRCAERAGSVLNWAFRFIDGLPRRLRGPAAKLIEKYTIFAEEVVPLSRGAKDALRLHDPDVVLVTPLIDIGSDQIEYVKACRAMRIPVAHCVASWDNLTNKGLIKAMPDRVFVWNEAQRREAIELHRIPPERVIITGAQIFDQWFDYQPSRTREEFCRQLGLEPERPIVLYTASSIFICRNESDFVLRWLKALRASADERLRGASVVIRPHPKAAKTINQWDNPRLNEFGPLVVFPRRGHMPVSRKTRDDYFDSLYHCAAVVGINTSAMLEAGILGRRCFTVVLDDVKEGQEGMVHFQHLTRDGFLGVATSLDEHLQQLSGELDAPTSTTRFVQSFLRPHGLNEAATPIFVANVEDMEDLAVEGGTATASLGWFLRPLLLPVVLLNALAALGNWLPALGNWLRRLTRESRKESRRAGRRLSRSVKAPFKFVSRSLRLGWRLLRRMLQRGRRVLGGLLRGVGLLPLLPETQPQSSECVGAKSGSPAPETTVATVAERRHVA